MRYGYFDDEHREYVITRPDTPLPWINYLGCEDYFGIISNTAGGYSFYKDARLRRLTRYRYNNAPLDEGGRYIYIRENDLTSSQNKSLDGLDILTLIFYSRLIKSGFLAIGNSNVSTHI